MEASTVYYTDFRCPVGTSLTEKLRRLCIAAGIKNIDMEGKFVAIKMHFGELGNLAYLRPNYAKVVADLCKEQGGMPFLTDCNTLYPGSRKNALEHLTCAQLNGFWPMTTGCQVIIADGLRGTDEVEVPVPNGEYCKTAKIGRAIMDADIFISLSHFKGHEFTSEIGFAVFLFRFETPAMYIFGVVYTIFVAGIDILTARKESYPTVVDTRCHRSFGKKNQRAMHSDGAIIVAGKAQYRTDFTVLRKTLCP